jgi:hypothetical protein
LFMKNKLFLAGILRKMKKCSIQKRLAELALALLIAGFMSCNNETEPTPVADNLSSGVFSEESAKAIFDYETVSGGVKIVKFKNANALKAYLNAGASSSVQSLNIARAADDAGSGAALKLNKIGSAAVVGIGAGAFSPEKGAASLTDAGVSAIRLPEKLTTIAPDAFKGAKGLTVQIPETLANKSSIMDQIQAMEEESKVTTETSLSESSGANELAGKKRVYYSSSWTEKIEFSASTYQQYIRKSARPGVEWTKNGSGGYSWDTSAKKVYLQDANVYTTYYYTITENSVWLSMLQDSDSAISGCAYSEKVETNYGTHYLLSITYDAAVSALTEALGAPIDSDSWSLYQGSALSWTEGAVVLEVNYDNVRLTKRENDKSVVTPWRIASTSGALPTASGQNELSGKAYDQSVRINPIRNQTEFFADGTYTISYPKNATELYPSESGVYSWNTADKTVTLRSNWNSAIKTFYYTVSGDSLTLALLKDSGRDIGGCAYSDKAETTSEGIHYLLSISYDKAVDILTEQFGEPQDGTEWGMQSSSSLSNTNADWLILELSPYDDIRLVQYVGGKTTVTPWGF